MAVYAHDPVPATIRRAKGRCHYDSGLFACSWQAKASNGPELAEGLIMISGSGWAPGFRDYAVLKARVRDLLVLGRRRVEKEFLLLRYQTGLLINEHLRLNNDRAAYGTKALLRYSVFARAYPIQGGRPELKFNLPLDALPQAHGHSQS